MGLLTRFFAIASLLLLVAACQGLDTKPDRSSADPKRDSLEQQVAALLQQAETAPPSEQLALILDAAELLAGAGDADWARSLLQDLPAAHIPRSAQAGPSYGRLMLINSYIAESDGAYPLALQWLSRTDLLEALPSYQPALSAAIRWQRAQLLFNLQDYSASIEERLALHALLSDPIARDTNHTYIWQTLMELPLEALQELVQTAPTREARGWYELAALSKNNQTNLRQQLAQVEEWVRYWPEHPASLQLPADLQLLQQLVEQQPTQVAILLPFSGQLSSAANAIRDGIMAAFYQLQTREPNPPSLKFYDTSEQHIDDLYQLALDDGAELVIGPLAKQHIDELALRPEMPVPTLALNTIDNPLGAVPNLYQFGLAVEDESAQAAEQAWRDGYRRALVIAPRTNWGDRSADAFSDAWLALGGDLINDMRFDDVSDYSDLVHRAFALDESEQRAQQIRRLVGNITFEPRRRQDIDMVFLAADARQARQIKPTLNFHYAGDVAVYATSHVFTGRVAPELDQDMEGIRFAAMPWFFNHNLPEKAQLTRHADTSANLQSFYALGVDSFHLYPRLQQLQQVTQAQFYGQTGRLRLNDEGQVRRIQDWAEFNRGRPRRLAEPNL